MPGPPRVPPHLPLVSPGYKQSSLAARNVLQQLASCGAPPVTTIYSSPTARTMGTAAAMAQEVGVSQVLPAYGLNCCAAAKMIGWKRAPVYPLVNIQKTMENHHVNQGKSSRHGHFHKFAKCKCLPEGKRCLEDVDHPGDEGSLASGPLSGS